LAVRAAIETHLAYTRHYMMGFAIRRQVTSAANVTNIRWLGLFSAERGGLESDSKIFQN